MSIDAGANGTASTTTFTERKVNDKKNNIKLPDAKNFELVDLVFSSPSVKDTVNKRAQEMIDQIKGNFLTKACKILICQPRSYETTNIFRRLNTKGRENEERLFALFIN